jgi:hypothetical protein
VHHIVDEDVQNLETAQAKLGTTLGPKFQSGVRP